MVRKMIILLIATVCCALVSPLYALETGIDNLEVWGYVQHEMAFHTTRNSGTAPLYKDTYVSPLTGSTPLGHPASFAINGLLKENTNSHRGSMMKFEDTFNLKALYRIIPGRLEVFARFYLLFDSVYQLESDIGWERSGLPGRYAGPKSGEPRHKYRDDFNNSPEKRILREFW